MKHIFLNLKRFDIPREHGGVNSVAPMGEWAKYIIENTQEKLIKYENNVEFAMFFPEAHLIGAMKAKGQNSQVKIGCQSVFREDTAVGGNFGAFTTNRTANSAKSMGCEYTIIGHCEERKDKLGIIKEAGMGADASAGTCTGASANEADAVNRLLNKEIKCAINAGLKVLYCIGETSEEQENWEEVLRKQLKIGLEGVDLSKVVIAYEPVWAIGPGKTPASKEYIQNIASFVKNETNGLPVVYGGGLKADNAKMLASIPEIDGGLIALTRFGGEIGFYPEEYLEIIDLYTGC
jgi:triosephosphate isomerase (TIM)